MKLNKLILIAILLLSSFSLLAAPYRVRITVSEKDALIYAEGKQVGIGYARVTVPAYSELHIQIKKNGFTTIDEIFYNKHPFPDTPKDKYFIMQKADDVDASVSSDKANNDFTTVINKKFTEEEAWRIASNVVTDYFDVVEVSDRTTLYLRTAWVVQNFQNNTVRTRLIIKPGGSDPLAFKMKIVSEYSGEAGTSVKDDQKFKEWDRILKKYEQMITDFQARLGNH